MDLRPKHELERAELRHKHRTERLDMEQSQTRTRKSFMAVHAIEKADLKLEQALQKERLTSAQDAERQAGRQSARSELAKSKAEASKDSPMIAALKARNAEDNRQKMEAYRQAEASRQLQAALAVGEEPKELDPDESPF